MSDSEKTAPEVHFERAARAAGGLAILIGSVGLTGWVLDIDALKSVLPTLVTMKPNTAVGIVCAGLSLWLQSPPREGKQRRLASTLSALAALALGLLTLSEYLFGVNL